MSRLNQAMSLKQYPPCVAEPRRNATKWRVHQMLQTICRNLLSLIEPPVQHKDLDEWAQLEFGRPFHSSDLDGRLL
jgi:hypothetical protein